MNDNNEEYNTHELPRPSQQLRIRRNKRRNLVANLLAIFTILILLIGIAAIVYVLFWWR